MNIVSGIDIVSIQDFSESVETGGKNFLDTVFLPQEQRENTSLSSLAGIFAAKEAIIKGTELTAGDWHNIHITKDSAGKPQAAFTTQSNFLSHDISISHTDETAVAIFFGLTP